MKRISDKRRKREEEAWPVREALRSRFHVCWICGGEGDLTCHEVLNGHGLRQKTLDEPCSLLLVCWGCNSGPLTNKGEWPVARQLAVLKKWHPEAFDLERFCWLAGRPKTWVTESEVEEWMN